MVNKIPPRPRGGALPGQGRAEPRREAGGTKAGAHEAADQMEAAVSVPAAGAAVGRPPLSEPLVASGRLGRPPTGEWGLLAAQLAAIVAQHPGADRRVRARLFARAILRRPRWASLFAAAGPKDWDEMCDAIGDAVLRSPHFAQLVDHASLAGRADDGA